MLKKLIHNSKKMYKYFERHVKPFIFVFKFIVYLLIVLLALFGGLSQFIWGPDNRIEEVSEEAIEFSTGFGIDFSE